MMMLEFSIAKINSSERLLIYNQTTNHDNVLAMDFRRA